VFGQRNFGGIDSNTFGAQPSTFDWSTFLEVELITDDLTAEEIAVNSKNQHLSPPMIKKMKKMSLIASIAGGAMFVGVWILWPFAMYGSRYVFSKKVREPDLPLRPLPPTED
jgi:hypothetical protein